MNSSFSTFQNALAYTEQQDKHRRQQQQQQQQRQSTTSYQGMFATNASNSNFGRSSGNRTPARAPSTTTSSSRINRDNKNNGYLPSATMAVPVQYLGSTDITGLHTPAHFYRVILPPISSTLPVNEQETFDKATNNNDNNNKDENNSTQEVTSNLEDTARSNNTPLVSSIDSNNNNNTNKKSSTREENNDNKMFDDEASPIIYVMSKQGANVILAKNNHRMSFFQQKKNNHNGAASSSAAAMMMMDQGDFENVQESLVVVEANDGNNNSTRHNQPTSSSKTFLQDALVETIEYAHVQCLLMSKQEAQKLIDEAGCVPSRIWKNVPLISLCASSDFPIASATAFSTVGKVFLSGGDQSAEFDNQNDDDDDEDDDEIDFVDDDDYDEEEDDENNNNDGSENASAANRSSNTSPSRSRAGNNSNKRKSNSRRKHRHSPGSSSTMFPNATMRGSKSHNHNNNSVVGVRVSLARARRVIHIMNEGVVSNESSPIAKVLRGLCAAIWCALIINASEEALEYVKPSLSVAGNSLVGSAHATRLWHIRRLKKRRESLFTVDATAGALLNSELRESKALTKATTAIKQQLYRSLGKVTDLVGSAMRHDVDWSDVERPPYGRELRRTHFRPVAVSSGKINSMYMNSNDVSRQQQQEPIFLWSRALPPIPVVLSRQGWERCIQRDPVMWRFKSLPVRLKETTTKLSRYLSCSVSDLLIAESTQIARATVLRSLPWTPGDTLLLVDGLPPGVYTALSSFLKEQNGVTIHTLGISHPISSNSEVIVDAFNRAIDLVKPLVCIIPHVTRTGHVLPIDRLIPLCRQRNVVVIVDGTDVLNNVAMQVGTFGADFYIAPLDGHMFCPAGLTALVVSKTRKKAIDTLTVSYFFGQGFEEEWTYTGLTDQSRMISIIQAMQFNKAVCPDQSQYTKQLAAQAHDFLTQFWNVPSLYESKEPECAVVAVLLPLAGQRHEADAKFLQALLTKKQVFVEVFSIRISRTNDHKLVVRLLFYPYNDMLEVKGLAIAMQKCIAEIS